MSCVIKNNGKVTSVTLDGGQESILFRTIASLPFITDNEQALQYYAYTLTPTFKKSAKDLVTDENGEPVLVFRSLSENNDLLNSSGLVFSTDYDSENKNDVQSEGVVFGFLRQKKKDNQKYELINGSEFKKRYLTTNSKQLEKVFFTEDSPSMGSVLGKGQYYSVSEDSSNHYQEDEYFDGIDYIDLEDSTKILLVNNSENYSGEELRIIANNYGANGLYDINEGNDKPYLGLVLYNKNENISVLESNFSEAIENMDRQSVLELNYPDGTRKFAIQNQNLFVQLEKFNKNVTSESYDGFVAELERQGVTLETKKVIKPITKGKDSKEIIEAGTSKEVKALIDKISPAKAILQQIVKDKNNYSEIAQKLLEIGDEAGLKVKLFKGKKGTTSYYYVATDKISIAENHLDNLSVIVHEIIHGLTLKKIPAKLRNKLDNATGTEYFNVLQDYLKTGEDEAVKNIINAYLHTVKIFDYENILFGEAQLAAKPEELAKTTSVPYGLADIDEFITEAFSNPDFQETLNSLEMPLTLKSIYQTIIDAIKNLLSNVLGVPALEGSLLEYVIENSAALINRDRELPTGREKLNVAKIIKNEEEQVSSRTIRESASLSPIHQELEVLLGGYEGTIEAYNTKNRIESNRERIIRESKMVEAWAREKGYLIEDLSKIYYDANIEGAESHIYLDRNNDNIIIKDFSFASYNGFQGALGRILLHNYLFPEMAYKIIGFTPHGQFLNIVLEQPFVKNGDNSTIEQIAKYFKNLGFNYDKKTLQATHPSGIVLNDLHESNVLIEPNGAMFPIDIVAEYENKNIPFNEFIEEEVDETGKIAQRIRDKKIKGYLSAIDFGLTQTIYNAALEFMAQQVENGTKLGNAIAKTLKWIDGEMIGQKWEKGKFAKYMNDQYKVQFQGKEVEVVRDDSKEAREIINGFYSPLQQAINTSKTDKLKGKEWLRKLLGTTEGDELRFTGIEQFLTENKENVVTLQELKQWIHDNKVEIVEVVKGKEISRNYKLTEAPYEGLGIDSSEALQILSVAGNIDNPRLPEYLEKRYGKERGANILNYLQNYAEDLGEYIKDVKYEKYQLEGEKSNYREVLVVNPSKPFTPEEYDKVAEKFGLQEKAQELYGKKFSQLDNNERTEIEFQVLYKGNYREYEKELKKKRNEAYIKFQTSHFEEPNILVHLRLNTRTDADGKKVLFIEELQSDWGQKGKKEGFKKDKKDIKPELDKISKTLKEKYNVETVEGAGNHFHFEIRKHGTWLRVDESAYMDVPSDDARLLMQSYKDYMAELQDHKLPQAPFVTDTNSWVKLGLKVALKEAVAQNAEAIAWTTGEQQNERYDLSKEVGSISYKKLGVNSYEVTVFKPDSERVSVTVDNPERNVILYDTMSEKKLKDTFGKDVAERIINDEGTLPNNDQELADIIGKELKGDNLKMGGKGMIGFYGSPKENKLGIIGQQAKSLFKQELKEIIIESGKTKPTDFADFDTYMANIVKVENTEDVKKYSKSGYKFLDASNKVIDKNRAYELIERGQKLRAVIESKTNQHSIEITPELKQTVTGGIPLFGKIEFEDLSTPEEDNISTDISIDEKIEIMIQNGEIERSCRL